MALSSDLEILNRVLRDLSGSFLQYVGECWPWTSVGPEGTKQRAIVQQCLDRQRHSMALLADSLTSRQSRVEFGPFASDFTDRHYVSLQFLLKQLVAGQTRLVESANRAATLLPSGDEARSLLDVVCRNESDNLAALKAAQSF